MSNAPAAEQVASDSKIEQNYSDFSQVATVEETMIQIGSGEHLTTPAASSHFSDSNFPVKLHYMLSELEVDGMSHIVSWQPHGRCFLVHKPVEFVEKILSLYVL